MSRDAQSTRTLAREYSVPPRIRSGASRSLPGKISLGSVRISECSNSARLDVVQFRYAPSRREIGNSWIYFRTPDLIHFNPFVCERRDWLGRRVKQCVFNRDVYRDDPRRRFLSNLFTNLSNFRISGLWTESWDSWIGFLDRQII